MNSVSRAALLGAPPSSADDLPDWIERRIEGEPVHSDKRGLAKILSDLFGPISYRTVENRPLVWRMSNGKAVTPTRSAVEAEYRRFKASPEYRTRRTPEASAAAKTETV
jgi:hypothetical protein